MKKWMALALCAAALGAVIASLPAAGRAYAFAPTATQDRVWAVLPGGPEKKPEEEGTQADPAPEKSAPSPEPAERPKTPAVSGPAPQAKSPAPDAVDTLLDDMTLEEQAAQLFLTRVPADGAPFTRAPGGYILFAGDFAGKTAEEVQGMTAALQAGAKVPLLVAVDEEGGGVTRVSSFAALRPEGRFPSSQQLYAQGGMEAVEADAAEKAALLQNLGINVNMAPVCDVSQDPADFIYGRTFGADAAATGMYVDRVVHAMERAQIGNVLKHFPGYGPNADTHTGSAYDARPYEAFRDEDFLPFAAGIDAGADCVLVSHNVMACVDGDGPASLSPGVHNLLRESLGFTGVVMTDDLMMEAIASRYTPGEAAVAAVLAGNDMLCTPNYEEGLAAVVTAVERGAIPAARVRESAARVLRWKQDLGLLESLAEQ